MEKIHNKYVYQDIGTERHEIRLLELFPGERSSTIAARLVHRSLDENPNYDALSYMWGDPTITVPIKVGNDDNFNITVNLEHALRDLRSTDCVRTLLIDAICINQHNTPERNEQVKLMGTIYEKAALVRTWLDLADDANHPAFTKLGHLTKDSTHSDLNDGVQFWKPISEIGQNQYRSRIWNPARSR